MTLEIRRRRRLLALFIFLLCGRARWAPAHDPFEVTTVATLRDESMTLALTMTRSTAVLVSGLDITVLWKS